MFNGSIAVSLGQRPARITVRRGSEGVAVSVEARINLHSTTPDFYGSHTGKTLKEAVRKFGFPLTLQQRI